MKNIQYNILQARKNQEKMSWLGNTKKQNQPDKDISLDVWAHQIGPVLEDKGFCILSQLSKNHHRYFKSEINKRAYPYLLSYVVQGKQNETENMLKANPFFLTIKGSVADYSGRTFKNVTPFQLALLTHDVHMWKKMIPYFSKLPDGKKKLEKQFNELFSNGLPEQKPYNIDFLVQSISQSQAHDICAVLEKKRENIALYTAIKHFRKTFTDLSYQEAYFNPQHLINAYNVYIQQYQNWTGEKNTLFWRQVIGFIQRFIPTCYAQAFCQGLDNIVVKKKRLNRSLEFTHGEGSYFPLSSETGLGFDFAIYGGLPVKLFPLTVQPWGLGDRPSIKVKVLLDKLDSDNTAELRRFQHRILQSSKASHLCCTIS